jgi:signal transduction histidine kinase/HAMP domain-containing protein
MLISLLGSTAAFIGGTALKNKLTKQQIESEIERVIAGLFERTKVVSTAARLLANDPEVMEAIQVENEASLGQLNGRAVVVRNRFNLDLIQIYDSRDQARTNLLLSPLYKESTLLQYTDGSTPTVHAVDGHLLLLSRSKISGDLGTIVVGIDLKSELDRLVSEYRLSTDLGIEYQQLQVGTQEDLPFDTPSGWHSHLYTQHVPVTLGSTDVDLLAIRSTAEITEITRTGLVIIIGSTVLTAVLLASLSVAATRSIVYPVQQISFAAQRVAQGDLNQSVEIDNLASPFGIGSEDEIGLLAQGFNSMVAQLREFYEHLEAKVESRTQDLTTAADVARAISSSLELGVVLETSTNLIYNRLGFYAINIFLVDPQVQVARLKESSGSAGQKLKEQDLTIPLNGKSLISTAIQSHCPRIVQDVSADPTYLPHTLLPDTRSEAAIPLLVEQKAIGVLDVQSKRRNAFSPEVVNLLNTLADQIAMGVHNANLYAQQKETTEHLAAINARLQELDQTKNQFIQNVSHELRTPLALIRGYAEALEGDVLGSLRPDQGKAISVIARRSRVLSKLVEDITALLELETETPPMSAAVSIAKLARQAEQDFQTVVEEKQLKLQVEIVPGTPCVPGEEHHLRKVVDNLVNNALKFTPSGGSVNVYVYQENGHVMLQVSDTGIGIPPEKQPHVFERFYQVDGSIRRRYGGTGLGLALVKEVVEAHKGKVSVESKVGRGSTFTVALPAINGKGAPEASTLR